MKKMKNQTFNEFLEEWHIELYPELLDDDLPDAYDNWLADLSADDFIKYGDFYGKTLYLKGKEEVYNEQLEKLQKKDIETKDQVDLDLNNNKNENLK